MKKLLLLSFLAIASILAIASVNSSTEKVSTKTHRDAPFDYNPNVYPHSTGLCYCGKGPNCHPGPGPVTPGHPVYCRCSVCASGSIPPP